MLDVRKRKNRWRDVVDRSSASTRTAADAPCIRRHSEARGRCTLHAPAPRAPAVTPAVGTRSRCARTVVGSAEDSNVLSRAANAPWSTSLVINKADLHNADSMISRCARLTPRHRRALLPPWTLQTQTSAPPRRLLCSLAVLLSDGRPPPRPTPL
eukprot:5511664-Prymnesium_polylepis.1